MVAPATTNIAGSLSSCIAVSINPEGSHNHRPETLLLGTGRFAATGLEVAPTGRAPQIDTSCRIDRRMTSKIRFGAHASTRTAQARFEVAQSSSPSTWSNDGATQPGWRTSCVTTRRTLPPWTCSLFNYRFDLLYAFVIVRLDRRDLVWINVHSKIRRRMGCTSNNEHFLG